MRARLLLVVLLCAALALPVPAAAGPQETRAAGQAEGGLLGAFVSRGDRSDAGLSAAVIDLEANLGRRLDINHHFVKFFDPLAHPLAAWDVAEGRIPMLSWHGVSSSTLASGRADDWVAEQAAGVAALQAPVLVRYGWEMDSQRNARWAGTPDEFVAAWRHLRAVFAAEGATNALWVWCPQALGFSNGRADAYYPGEEHVDWICANGYNFSPGKPASGYRQLEQIFRPFYDWAEPLGKPLMIGETGVQERRPGEKAAWIRSANVALQQHMPAVKALVYFDTHAEYDWQLHTTPESFAGFRELANDPYWNH